MSSVISWRCRAVQVMAVRRSKLGGGHKSAVSPTVAVACNTKDWVRLGISSGVCLSLSGCILPGRRTASCSIPFKPALPYLSLQAVQCPGFQLLPDQGSMLQSLPPPHVSLAALGHSQPGNGVYIVVRLVLAGPLLKLLLCLCAGPSEGQPRFPLGCQQPALELPGRALQLI